MEKYKRYTKSPLTVRSGRSSCTLNALRVASIYRMAPDAKAIVLKGSGNIYLSILWHMFIFANHPNVISEGMSE